MEIKTPYEIWQDIPSEDNEDRAIKEKWVSVESLEEWIKTQSSTSTAIINLNLILNK